MADKPFDRQVINQRERPLSSDVNQGWSYGDQALRYLLDNLTRLRGTGGDASAALAPPIGFIGDGFHVRADSPLSMSVVVADGLGFFTDPTSNATDIGSALTPGVLGVDDDQRMHPLPLSTAETLTAPVGGAQDRIDIVEVKLDRRLEDATSRQVLDAGTGMFSAVSVNKTLAFDLAGRGGVNTTGGNSTTGIALKTGVEAGVPVAPATSTGYVKIAEIYVSAITATLSQDQIQDLRPIVALDGVRRVSAIATVNNTAPAVPASVEAVCTPGFDVLAVYMPATASLRTQFWIFGGLGLDTAKVAAQATIVDNGVSSTTGFSIASVKQIAQGVLTSGNIATITASSPIPATLAAKLAIGQPYVRVDVSATQVTTSLGISTAGIVAFSNPHALHLDVTIR